MRRAGTAGRRPVVGWGGAALAAPLVVPASASAHGLSSRADLPVPGWLFAWAAALVLIVSFVGLGALWREPRLEHPHERPLLRVPVVLEVLLGALGIALFAIVVYAGLAGTDVPTANLAPTTIYVLFWVGLVPVSLLLGDVWAALSPWRALARATAWVACRTVGGELPAPLTWPARLGRWPAVLGLLGFAWLELVASGRDDPHLLAVLALAYAGLMLVGMALFGIEPWTRNADGFANYFGMFGRCSPLVRRGRRLMARPPGAGLVGVASGPGVVAFVCVAIGSTTWDGFSNGPVWGRIGPGLIGDLQDAGLGYELATDIILTAGLLVAVGLVAGLYRLGVAGMARLPGAPRELAARFVGSLVPIAAAYVLAHYLSSLAFQGQATIYLASDPLGTGANLFGTADRAIDYTALSANAIWYLQVGTLVLGHAAGLAVAHDRALSVFPGARAASRSQLWMLGVMIAFTGLALWLLSSAET